MKHLITILFALVLTCNSYSQYVGQYIFQVRMDSIEKTVRELSGEDSTFVDGQKVLILNRENYTNDLAAEYIIQRLESYNLPVSEHKYSSTGRNIIATQQGVGKGDSTLIICGHYDAVADYCADDNASGVAAIVEAARILSAYDFEYTIKYILFDEEEIGLVGSEEYVDYISAFPPNILCVINIDMIGWESMNSGSGYDSEFDVISNDDPLSLSMMDEILDVVETYNLNLVPMTHYNISGSDHSSFWEGGFPAVCYSEAFHSGDPNPYYHTPSDRISKFHMPYFMELVKLGVGTLAKTAIPFSTTSIHTTSPLEFALYPNPSNGQAVTIHSDIQDGTLEIYSLNGSQTLVQRIPFNGKTSIETHHLKAGIYAVKLISGSNIGSQKLVVL